MSRRSSLLLVMMGYSRMRFRRKVPGNIRREIVIVLKVESLPSLSSSPCTRSDGSKRQFIRRNQAALGGTSNNSANAPLRNPGPEHPEPDEED